MCCIDCRNQKFVLYPTKNFYVQGNQDNRHWRTFSPTLNGGGGGVNDVERL